MQIIAAHGDSPNKVAIAIKRNICWEIKLSACGLPPIPGCACITSAGNGRNHAADINRPHGGIMYMHGLKRTSEYTLPDLPDEEKSPL